MVSWLQAWSSLAFGQLDLLSAVIQRGVFSSVGHTTVWTYIIELIFKLCNLLKTLSDAIDRWELYSVVLVSKFEKIKLLGSRNAVDGENPINPQFEIF